MYGQFWAFQPNILIPLCDLSISVRGKGRQSVRTKKLLRPLPGTPEGIETGCSIFFLQVHLPQSTLVIPHICQFWFTTALFRPIQVHQKKSVNLRQNSPNWLKWAKVSHSLCWKSHRLEKSSLPAVVAVVTNMCPYCRLFQNQTLLHWGSSHVIYNVWRARGTYCQK